MLTSVTDVSNQVQKFWSPIFVPELLEKSILPALCNKKYEGEIKEAGDTVYVSQITRPTAQRKTVGSGHETFDTSTLATSRVALVADQVFSAAFKFDDLVKLQSQIGQKDSEIRQALLESIMIEVNNFCYSKVAPSTSAPDHSTASVTDFNTAALLTQRRLASTAKWADNDRYMLLDPSYMNDMLATGVMTSSDYIGDDAPVVQGKMLKQRFGYWIVEDNSAGLLSLSPAAAGADVGLGFIPDWLLLALGNAEFKVSDLHSNQQFGYVISCRVIGGACLGISGNVKHQLIYAT